MNYIRLQVTWLKVDKGKFFEYISGRNPPFRNSTIEGAEIDVSMSRDKCECLTTNYLIFS